MKALKPWWLLSLRIKTLGNKTQILDKSLVKKKKKEAEEEEEKEEEGGEEAAAAALVLGQLNN